MRKKLIFISGLLAAFTGLAATASAQQLYISSISVRYPTGKTTDHYCENGYSGTDNDVSFISLVNAAPVNPNDWSAKIEWERPRVTDALNPPIDRNIYPGGCLKLCAEITCVVPSTPTTFGIDELTFEVFKFGAGSNPLDPASTPPINTINMFNIATCSQTTGAPGSQAIGPFCASWTGAYNLNGIFGKSNGQFGFRAKVKTNQVSATAGNISIEQTSAYPGANQKPISVDVVNVHTVRSTPTVVGRITGVAAQPYNILYRLSKGANTTINLYSTEDLGTPVRTIIDGMPRIGEGIPDGTLTNGDFWDGRDNSGSIMPAGTYIAYINAVATDYFGSDVAYGATSYIELDPLQVTDVAIKPLGASATDTANISYMLTEAATVYVDIYPPGTSFNDVNMSPPTIGGVNQCVGDPATDTCLRHYAEQKDRRVTATTVWDGRNSFGNPVCDGDYVYAVYAVLPSVKGPVGGQIWTSKTMVGTVPVARGSVVANLSQSSTIIGSTPTATALDPFYFSYTPARDTSVSLNIKSSDGTTIKRNLLVNVPRTGNFLTRDSWDGKDNTGAYVPAGDYMAELVTRDAYQCSTARTSTSTVRMSVNLFRVVDLQTKPLLGGASEMASISFEFSQPMYLELNVYPPSVVIDPSQVWPTGGTPTVAGITQLPVYSAKGMRPGRFKITEYWDGRNEAGALVEDGRYPFVLLAHSTGTATTMYPADKTYGYVDIARGQIIFTVFEVTPSIPTMFSSSDSVTLPPYEIAYSVTRQSSVTIQIWTLDLPSTLEATVISGQIRDGDILYRDFWDGKDANGNFVPGGAYNVRVTAQDMVSALASKATVQTTIDVFPLRIYDVAITPLTLDNPAVVSYQVSEPMKVVTQIFKPGTTFNSSGVPTPPEALSLVKRIIGVRASRTQVSEYWDGTDMTLSKVPDGNYMFKVFASPDTDKITTSSGAVLPGALLADDVVTSNISVTRGASSTGVAPMPKEDFMRDTFFYPNPYEGKTGCFHIGVTSLVGKATIKIYNVAGDLVYKSAEFEPPMDYRKCTIAWPKTNMAGRTVAPGVYFAVVRFAATQGTSEVWQTVKKILVP